MQTKIALYTYSAKVSERLELLSSFSCARWLDVKFIFAHKLGLGATKE